MSLHRCQKKKKQLAHARFSTSKLRGEVRVEDSVLVNQTRQMGDKLPIVGTQLRQITSARLFRRIIFLLIKGDTCNQEEIP